MIIVAVDPGLKHLGWSVFDTVKNSFISFGVYDLVKDVPKKDHNGNVRNLAIIVYLSSSIRSNGKSIFSSNCSN